MMMVTNLCAAQTAEKFLRHVRAGTIGAVRLSVIDALHFKAGVQTVPARGFIGVHNRSRLDAGLNPVERRAFRAEDSRDGIAVTLTNDNRGLALAVLVGSKAAIYAVLDMVGRLNVPAEMAAVDFRDLASAADRTALHFFGHRLTQLVAENESALVGKA